MEIESSELAHYGREYSYCSEEYRSYERYPVHYSAEVFNRGLARSYSRYEAAVTFEELARCVPDKEMAMFRIVPNTAIRVLQSMTLVAERNVSAEQRQALTEMLGEMGRTMPVEEKGIAAATALCSCGIAYVMKYVQACVQAGIELGVRPADGKELVAQTLKGAALLLEDPAADPSKEIESVCTPGGYTIRGINELDHAGFPSAIVRAMKACMY